MGGWRGVKNRPIQSLCWERLDPTGPLLHLAKGKGLFSKATSSEGLWIHHHQQQKKGKVRLKTDDMNDEPALAPPFPPTPLPQNTPMANYQARDWGCFSGKAEVPQKKQLQILTFWGSLQKSLLITPHPQYPSGPISNAPFSLKHPSSLKVIIPRPEPTALAQNLSHPICTEDTPVLPPFYLQDVSILKAEILAQFFPSPFPPSPPNPIPWA